MHSYYELATLNLELAWNPKFHFAPFLDDKQSLREALSAHDHYQFMTMGVKPGMRGLDAGCGVGEPAREYARWADVSTTFKYECFNHLTIPGSHHRRHNHRVPSLSCKHAR